MPEGVRECDTAAVRYSLCVVTASPMTIDSFMVSHLESLSGVFDIVVASNFSSQPGWTSNSTFGVFDVGIERKPHLSRDFVAWLTLWRHFKRHRYDLVLSVTPKAGLLAMSAARLARVPGRVHWFTGQVWATKTGLARALLKWLDSVTAWSASFCLIDSHSQREFLIDEGVCSGDASVVLGAGSICGVDGRRFHPDEHQRAHLRETLAISHETTVFLFMGRLVEDKGVRELCEAFSRLPGQSALLLLVGPDEAGLVDWIQGCASQSANPIRICGVTSAPEHYYQAADILCLPSRREGFGVTVIEAAACGIPALATRIYGLSDSVIDGVTGTLVAPSDVSSLSRAMQRFIDDPELTRVMGASARARALTEFPQERLTSELSTFLVSVARPE